jgi:hypothetical protein
MLDTHHIVFACSMAVQAQHSGIALSRVSRNQQVERNFHIAFALDKDFLAGIGIKLGSFQNDRLQIHLFPRPLAHQFKQLMQELLSPATPIGCRFRLKFERRLKLGLIAFEVFPH